jgi:hypothetical protein
MTALAAIERNGSDRQWMALMEVEAEMDLWDIRMFIGLPDPIDYRLFEDRLKKSDEDRAVARRTVACWKHTVGKMPDSEIIASWKIRMDRALTVCTEEGVRRHIAIMLGAFPNARPHEPKVYVAALIYDVLDLRIPDACVAAAAQDVRRSFKFVPAVSEFLTLATARRDHFTARRDTLHRFEQRRAERLKAIAETQALLEEMEMSASSV